MVAHEHDLRRTVFLEGVYPPPMALDDGCLGLKNDHIGRERRKFRLERLRRQLRGDSIQEEHVVSRLF